MCTDALSTHLRAGEITVRQVNCSSLTFEITLVVYTNVLNTNITFGGDGTLSFGDGTSVIVPEIINVEIVDAKLGIGKVTYTTLHTYAGLLSYTISYEEPNRNASVVNMSQAVNTRFYLETSLML